MRVPLHNRFLDVLGRIYEHNSGMYETKLVYH
jgi:hypothetical protein